MKFSRSLLFFGLLSLGLHAADTNVQRSNPGSNLTADFNIGAGRTVTVTNGGNIEASGTGTIKGPTYANGTSDNRMATTEFVMNNGGGSPGTVNWGNIGGSLSAQADLVAALALKANLASPTFTGTPFAPTAANGTNTGQIATTAFVLANAVSSVNWGSIGGSLASQTDLSTALGLKAPLASPAFTGTPTTPTAAVDTNTTQAASTAFVLAQAASATPLIDGTAAPGTSTRYARGDHVHPTDTSRAPIASPTFTGTPAAPTAAANTNTTQLATTAFVTTADNLKANIASPTFTGTPAAPTATLGDNSTQIATTAFVLANAGGTRTSQVITQSAHGFAVGNVLYNLNGTWTKARANALSTSAPTAVVESVTTNTFVAVYSGPITLTGLTASSTYYLSDATAGLTTTTAPTTTTSFVVPVFTTGTTTGAIVKIGQPGALAGVNLTTDVSGVLPSANGGVPQALSSTDKPTFANVTMTPSTLTYSTTTTIDFSGDGFKDLVLTGNVTFATSNLVAGKSVTIRMVASGGTRTLAVPGTWTPVGAAIAANLASGKYATLTMTSWGTTDANVMYAYSAQP